MTNPQIWTPAPCDHIEDDQNKLTYTLLDRVVVDDDMSLAKGPPRPTGEQALAVIEALGGYVSLLPAGGAEVHWFPEDITEPLVTKSALALRAEVEQVIKARIVAYRAAYEEKHGHGTRDDCHCCDEPGAPRTFEKVVAGELTAEHVRNRALGLCVCGRDTEGCQQAPYHADDPIFWQRERHDNNNVLPFLRRSARDLTRDDLLDDEIPF